MTSRTRADSNTRRVCPLPGSDDACAMAEHDLMTGEVTGVIQVDDWVRELPATHFQPCSCCLCRPPGGTRPIFRVRAIEREQGRTYFRFDGEQRYPAEEFERVDPPAKGADPVVIRNDPAANAALLREPEALARMRSLLREMGALSRAWPAAASDHGDKLPERFPRMF